MSTQKPPRIKRKASASQWSFIRLKDGRKIANPLSGGKFSKAEIRAAVKEAMERKDVASAG